MYELVLEYIEQNGWWMFTSQFIVFITGMPAILMTQSVNHNVRRWASIVAMSGQPGWYIMAWCSDAWGLFLMNFFYTFSWGKGIWSFWLKPYLEKREQRTELEYVLQSKIEECLGITPDPVVPWKPYLQNRADGVDGHYCSTRYNPDKNCHEFWNGQRWSSTGKVYVL